MSKIMVVEDDPVTQRMLGVRLSRAGHEVVMVEDGRAVIDEIRAQRPDVLLLDVTMSVGGFLIVERIKRLPSLADLPFIFMTANRNIEFRRQAMTLGAAGFFEKPVDITELLYLLHDKLHLVPGSLAAQA